MKLNWIVPAISFSEGFRVLHQLCILVGLNHANVANIVDNRYDISCLLFVVSPCDSLGTPQRWIEYLHIADGETINWLV